jgi:hypothetical protein
MQYFVDEAGFASAGPMTAESTLQYIQQSKALLGKLLVRNLAGKSISLKMLCDLAHDEETNALRLTT